MKIESPIPDVPKIFSMKSQDPATAMDGRTLALSINAIDHAHTVYVSRPYSKEYFEFSWMDSSIKARMNVEVLFTSR